MYKVKRQMDELGRIVIPKDIRVQADMNRRDYVDISCNDKIVKLEKNNFDCKIDNICNLIIKHLHNTFKNNIVIIKDEECLKIGLIILNMITI